MISIIHCVSEKNAHQPFYRAMPRWSDMLSVRLFVCLPVTSGMFFTQVGILRKWFNGWL